MPKLNLILYFLLESVCSCIFLKASILFCRLCYYFTIFLSRFLLEMSTFGVAQSIKYVFFFDYYFDFTYLFWIFNIWLHFLFIESRCMVYKRMNQIQTIRQQQKKNTFSNCRWLNMYISNKRHSDIFFFVWISMYDRIESMNWILFIGSSYYLINTQTHKKLNCGNCLSVGSYTIENWYKIWKWQSSHYNWIGLTLLVEFKTIADQQTINVVCSNVSAQQTTNDDNEPLMSNFYFSVWAKHMHTHTSANKAFVVCRLFFYLSKCT